MHVKSILIWLKEFQFGKYKLANFGLSFFNLAKVLTKESKTLAQTLNGINLVTSAQQSWIMQRFVAIALLELG